MTPAATSRPAIVAMACACAAAAAVPAHADSDDARAWLQRMSQALAGENYQGKFFHLSPTSSESMRIIHRVADGKVTEKLVSLDGSGREIIRTDAEIDCYMPDTRTVLVEPRSREDSLLADVPNYSEGLERFYTFETLQTAKLSGRSTQLIAVQPRDRYRYGYRLWLDRDTALPLKSQLLDHEGNVVEQILFSDLELNKSISADSVKPDIDSNGFRWLRGDPRGEAQSGNPLAAAPQWNVVHVPSGFTLTIRRVQLIAGSPEPVQHLVYSDGLASVSVFIQLTPGGASAVTDSAGSEAPRAGSARVGSASAYSVRVNGHQVTVVGEVPPQTVQEIAAGVTPQKLPVKADDAARAP